MIIAAMKQALEFISSVKVHPSQIAERDSLHDALQAAIAEAEKQEPVTETQKRAAFERFWVAEIGDKDDLTYGGLGYAINRVAVAWEAWKAATQRKPLTDEQIELGRRAPWGFNLDAFTAGARFAEAAHGIKEKNHG